MRQRQWVGAITCVILGLLWAAGSPAEDLPIRFMKAETLKSHLDAGDAIHVVDVRSRSAYEHEHIVGALSAPLSEVRIADPLLPKDIPLVLY
ncbi:MAG: rhodanese-like domain-containing protein [Candidatus Methylomirabilales bacterium]